ncbi:helix-turn-helix transcriptional regulator [Streptosporangium soli]
MSTHAVSRLFVGRAGELAALERVLAEARAGKSSTVFVGGEAGVGKTRLIREFAGRSGETRVLVGGCLELGTGGLPFAPFTAVLRTLAREFGRDGISALLPGGTTGGLARLLPEFGEPDADGAEARARLFEQVLGLLERLAEHQPLLLVIEDAHWADRSTRDLLSFLVRYRRPEVRMLIVVTYRADDVHRKHPLRPLLAELGRLDRVSRLELPRLTRREVVQQAVGILDREPAELVIDTIYARSEGNPLFVEVLLSGDGEHEALPESLRDLLISSVERLPEETQELLRVASASGARIEHALLAAVAGLDDDALSATLRPAIAGNVLTFDREGYAFRHALIHEAVHDDLLPGERVRLHTRFAEALEADLELLPAPRGAIELAYHWYAAHDVTWALISAWRAAAAARKSAAYDEQLRMLTRVLELWEKVPDAAARIETDHVGVLRQAITVAHLAGEYERGMALAKAALGEIDPDTDPVRAASLLRQRGIVAYDLGRAGFVDDLRMAARLLPADPPTRLRAQVLENLARVLHEPGEWAEKEALAEEARAIAKQVGDGSTEAQALVTLTWARYRYQDVEGQVGAFAEAHELAARARSYSALQRCAISESDALEGAGAHELAAEVARRGVADALDYGLSRTFGAFLSINLAEPLLSLGRWDEALKVIEHALELVPPPPYRASVLGFAMDIALARGDLDEAEAQFAEALSLLARGTYRAQTVLPNIRRDVELRWARGRADEARDLVERALREQDLAAAPRYAWPFLVTAARTASALSPALRELAGRLDVQGKVEEAHSLTFAAETARADLADLDSAAARDSARAAWDEAAAAWAALRQPYPQARALLAAAEIAVGGGARDEAAVSLAQAWELAGKLAAVPLTRQIADLARRARIPLDGEREPEEPRLGLTAREHEVLRLVAAGRTNREIAGELFISTKTASVHVSNILAKLGAASRGEAAATAHRMRLFDTPAAPGSP